MNDIEFKYTSSDLSEQRGLFHDISKLFERDLSVLVFVELIDHRMNLIVVERLSEFACDALQIFERDLSRLIVVEELEGFEDFFVGIAVQNFDRHNLLEVDVFDADELRVAMRALGFDVKKQEIKKI